MGSAAANSASACNFSVTKIYTRTGDRGQTGLWGGGRVLKSHPRVAAYGEVDELNSCLGAAIAEIESQPKLKALRDPLARIQKELFVVGAILATSKGKTGLAELPKDASSRLESEIDGLTNDLKPMRKFIMPGGSPAGAWLHLARTVCRRAERAVVALSDSELPSQDVLVYLNRLSDYLFTAARWANARLDRRETEWEGLARSKSNC